MSNDTKLSRKIKAQISRFAGRLSEGFTRPRRRFVTEMIYGIQASKDVKLSNIARALNESIALIKTENRLSRQLASEDLTHEINNRLCWLGARWVDADTVLAVDLSDLQKRYGKKMEYLAEVRDGSTGEIGEGYWLCQVLAAHPYGNDVVPLYGELYSCEAENFQSENDQILKAIRYVSRATGGQGVFVIDRGGDRRNLLNPLIDGDLRFVVRQRGDRHVLLPKGKKYRMSRAARWCKGTEQQEVEVERDGHRETLRLTLGSLPVSLPRRPDVRLWLVVIRGFGKDPIYLLTNVAPSVGGSHAVWISDMYLTRWKCEEAYRFEKQSYGLEDVRVRSYTALRTMFALVHAVFYFVSAVLGRRSKLSLIFKQVCEKAKRFYETAAFFQYAVADGIYRLLFGSEMTPSPPSDSQESNQLLFAFARAPS